ncbi:MAG: hypothetical protein IPM60_12810 [Rhodospirillales bacterium]|nr:hypothetical protein [Rhodospirillales bacterium]
MTKQKKPGAMTESTGGVADKGAVPSKDADGQETEAAPEDGLEETGEDQTLHGAAIGTPGSGEELDRMKDEDDLPESDVERARDQD